MLMGNAWATVGDVRDEQLPDADDFLTGVTDTGSYITAKINEASDLARTYLSRYSYFFSSWTATTVPAALRKAVVDIAIHYITSRPTKLARTTLEKTTWERNYDNAIAWLEKLAKGTAELDVQWPNENPLVSGHRCAMATGRRPMA
jgi:phage gp36-like protein